MVVLLYNPRSGGSGREAEVRRVGDALRSDGHGVVLVHAGADEASVLHEALRGAAVLVVVGGDGTMHHALGEASRAGVAVYHWPTGTENLFARQFGMTRSETALRRAINAAQVEEVDCGDTDGRLFSLMCSVGPDAAVVHRLQRVRSGSISRWSYLPHMLRELRCRPPTLRVWVDGAMVVDGVRGMCLVANSGQYGAGLGAAARASMTDGVLDVVFMPAGTTLGVMWWLFRARVGRHERDARLVYRTGREVVIANAGQAGAPVQCDGEATGELAPGGGADGAVQIVVRERALRVLTG